MEPRAAASGPWPCISRRGSTVTERTSRRGGGPVARAVHGHAEPAALTADKRGR